MVQNYCLLTAARGVSAAEKRKKEKKNRKYEKIRQRQSGIAELLGTVVYPQLPKWEYKEETNVIKKSLLRKFVFTSSNQPSPLSFRSPPHHTIRDLRSANERQSEYTYNASTPHFVNNNASSSLCVRMFLIFGRGRWSITEQLLIRHSISLVYSGFSMFSFLSGEKICLPKWANILNSIFTLFSSSFCISRASPSFKSIFFFSTSSYCRWVSCSHSSPSGVLHFSNNNRLDSTANRKDKITGLGEGREWERNSGQLILYAKNIMTNQYGITLNYHTFLAFHVKQRWMNIWNRFV